MYQRPYNFKYRKAIGFILLLLISIHINSQQSVDTIINYDDIITFKPPSKNFIPLLLQTHKNIIRLGQQNSYSLKPDGTYISHHVQPAFAKKIDKKETQLLYGRQALYELLKLKFMADIYADIDKEYFTRQSSSMYVKDKNSYYAQQHLLKLANAITGNKEMYRFFCNQKKEDCDFTTDKDVYYYKNIINGGVWGGKAVSEFEKLRSYKAYVKENLASLQQWSNTIFSDNTIEGYFVVKTYLYEYDFKSKGYWLDSNHFTQDSRFLLQYHNFEPKNENERKLLSPRTGVKILFEMSPSEAEKLTEKIKNIYLTFKIKTTLKGLEHQYTRIKANYTLESPIIEIYKDDDLTLKIGEFSIDTMTTK